MRELVIHTQGGQPAQQRVETNKRDAPVWASGQCPSGSKRQKLADHRAGLAAPSASTGHFKASFATFKTTTGAGSISPTSVTFVIPSNTPALSVGAPWSMREDRVLVGVHKRFKGNWGLIAPVFFPGRIAAHCAARLNALQPSPPVAGGKVAKPSAASAAAACPSSTSTATSHCCKPKKAETAIQKPNVVLPSGLKVDYLALLEQPEAVAQRIAKQAMRRILLVLAGAYAAQPQPHQTQTQTQRKRVAGAARRDAENCNPQLALALALPAATR